jgi:hypothetical protein
MIRDAWRLWAAGAWVLLAASLARAADKPAAPKVISVDPAELAAVKVRLADGDKTLKPALDRLIQDADKALKQRLVSVLDRKKSVAGADAHDYVSFAPYFWPDPDKPDGLPYIRKDGKHNRDLVRQGDRENFGAVKRAAHLLALAYYFTGEAKYAEHAAALLRAWFLDAKTHMNPNLDHGQAVPGGPTGRAAGLIEFRDMPQLLDALGLLEASDAWTADDRKAMRAWLTQYYDWLCVSTIGKGEEKADNNHGTWYDVQAMSLALYLGKTDDARRLAERFGERRIAAQVKPDGSQPRELGRADSWGYSAFNVTAMISMAELAERVDVDLWKFQTRDGRSIRAALDYLTPYLEDKEKWPHGKDKDHPADPAKLTGNLIRATRGLGAKPYQKMLEALPRSAWESSLDRLLHSHP